MSNEGRRASKPTECQDKCYKLRSVNEEKNMSKTKGYAASAAKAPLGPFTFERREPREHDVAIDIKFCGICHSDIHQARDEWGNGIFPMVPGHEIAGLVSAVGSKVTKYKVGDRVGEFVFGDFAADGA